MDGIRLKTMLKIINLNNRVDNRMFSKDNKWNIAKKFIKQQGLEGNWIEVVDYYRQIGGKHVAIFVYLNKIKYRILEATIDDRVILMDSENKFHIWDYEEVNTNRKEFFYIEEPNEYEYSLDTEIKKLVYGEQDRMKINQ